MTEKFQGLCYLLQGFSTYPFYAADMFRTEIYNNFRPDDDVLIAPVSDQCLSSR